MQFRGSAPAEFGRPQQARLVDHSKRDHGSATWAPVRRAEHATKRGARQQPMPTPSPGGRVPPRLEQLLLRARQPLLQRLAKAPLLGQLVSDGGQLAGPLTQRKQLATQALQLLSVVARGGESRQLVRVA